VKAKIKQYVRLTAFLALIITLSLSIIPADLYGNNTNSLQNRQNQTRSDMRAAREAFNRTNAERTSALSEIEHLNRELDELADSLEWINDELISAEISLDIAEAELEIATENREEQLEVLNARLRFMYINQNVGYLDILLNASSISDFLNRVDHIARIHEHDAAILTRLVETEERISSTAYEISGNISMITALQDARTERSEELENVLAQRRIFIESLEADAERYAAQVRALEAEDTRITRLIADEAARLARSRSAGTTTFTPFDGGQLTWPVPGHHQVSSPFGYRTSPISRRREHHNGIDIRAPHGTSVVAAADGTVIFSGWMNGMGNTVIINHGNISTLYGHHSRNLVSVGQTVQRGEVIARVGSTGWSTGPHLHFEVHVGNRRTDPMPYFRR